MKEVQVGSGVVVKDNKANNIYLRNGKNLKVVEHLGEGTAIGVSLENYGGTFTAGFKENNDCVDPNVVFVAETVEAASVPYAPPTCTEAGKTFIISRIFDGAGFMPQVKQGVGEPALGHDWGEWKVVTPATETAEGLEERTCARCGETETRSIPAEVAYRVVGGDGGTWTRDGNNTLAFTFKRSLADETTFDRFTGMTVDGAAVPEKGSSGKANYTTASGSLILTLQPSFLETLRVGNHEVIALFDDGSASAAFSVKSASSSDSDDNGDGDDNGERGPTFESATSHVRSR